LHARLLTNSSHTAGIVLSTSNDGTSHPEVVFHKQRVRGQSFDDGNRVHGVSVLKGRQWLVRVSKEHLASQGKGTVVGDTVGVSLGDCVGVDVGVADVGVAVGDVVGDVVGGGQFWHNAGQMVVRASPGRQLLALNGRHTGGSNLPPHVRVGALVGIAVGERVCTFQIGVYGATVGANVLGLELGVFVGIGAVGCCVGAGVGFWVGAHLSQSTGHNA